MSTWVSNLSAKTIKIHIFSKIYTFSADVRDGFMFECYAVNQPASCLFAASTATPCLIGAFMRPSTSSKDGPVLIRVRWGG